MPGLDQKRQEEKEETENGQMRLMRIWPFGFEILSGFV